MIVDHHYHVRLVHNEYDIKPSDTRHRQAYVRGDKRIDQAYSRGGVAYGWSGTV